MGEVLDGRYRLDAVIARGGMGVVMLANHLQLDRPVAIKFLHAHLAGDDTLWRRFQREVDISKELSHTNIVRIFDFGESQSGYMFLVMEFLEGEELKSMIAREGPQSTERVMAVAEQILDGVAEAHAADVIHRDLKPGNIFMTKDRRGRDVPKILDFGIAKSLHAVQQHLTSAGTITGTPGYVAPESFVHGDGGKQADVYALGLIFAEMLLGQRVVEAPTAAQAMIKHLQMPLILPQRIADTGLGKVLVRAVSKDPQQRYADADEMLSALHAAHSSTPNLTLTQQEVQSAVDAMNAALPDMSSPKTLQAVLDSATSSPNLPETATEITMDTNSLLEINQAVLAPPVATKGVPIWVVVAVGLVTLTIGGLIVLAQREPVENPANAALSQESPDVIAPPKVVEAPADPAPAAQIAEREGAEHESAEPEGAEPEGAEPEGAEAEPSKPAIAELPVETVNETPVAKDTAIKATKKTKSDKSVRRSTKEDKSKEINNILNTYLK